MDNSYECQASIKYVYDKHTGNEIEDVFDTKLPHYAKRGIKKCIRNTNGTSSFCKKHIRCRAYVKQQKDIWTGKKKKPRRCKKNRKGESDYCVIHQNNQYTILK